MNFWDSVDVANVSMLAMFSLAIETHHLPEAHWDPHQANPLLCWYWCQPVYLPHLPKRCHPHPSCPPQPPIPYHIAETSMLATFSLTIEMNHLPEAHQDPHQADPLLHWYWCQPVYLLHLPKCCHPHPSCPLQPPIPYHAAKSSTLS
jgi:hypothetical protein